MPLEVLGSMVVLGIALAWVLVRMLVNAPARLIESDEAASARFAEDFPTEPTEGSWLISDDGKVAFAKIAGESALALLLSIGSKQLTRRLTTGDISSVKQKGDGLVIALNDFTLPVVHVQLSDNDARDKLVVWLNECGIENESSEDERVTQS